MKRFVILHHTGWADHPDHYDLMLQTRESFDDNELTLLNYTTVTNEFPKLGTHFVLGNPHRQLYLQYEGTISDHRGHVKRVDEGKCTIFDNSRPDYLWFELLGSKLRGNFTFNLTINLTYVMEHTGGPRE